MPAAEKLAKFLAEQDAATTAVRLERLAFLGAMREGNNGILFRGGDIAAEAFHEMEHSYVNGCFISCVLTAQVVLEHTLAAVLEDFGVETNGKGFAKLCNLAHSNGVICDAKLDDFNSLRRSRNPYTHTTPMLSDSCMITRVLEKRIPPREIFKLDAESAIRTVVDYIAPSRS